MELYEKIIVLLTGTAYFLLGVLAVSFLNFYVIRKRVSGVTEKPRNKEQAVAWLWVNKRNKGYVPVKQEKHVLAKLRASGGM